MGNNCTRLPPPTQIIASETDALGHVFPLANFCGPAGSIDGYIAPYIDVAGEYSYSGAGAPCRYCSLDPPNSVTCSAGCADINCCSIIGHGATFARTSYKGERGSCCMGGPRIVEGKTCPPDFIPQNATCKNVILSECSRDKKRFIATGDVCNNYCSYYPAEGVLLKCSACNDPEIFNNNLSICKSICLENSGLCDVSVTQYCSQYPTDEFCSCISSTEKNNPVCTDATCRTKGYISTGIKNQQCIINNCNVEISFDNIRNLDINSLNVDQSCGDVGVEDALVADGKGVTWRVQIENFIRSNAKILALVVVLVSLILFILT
uniref:Pox virus entry-fusion-complex G9/A16 n=1 Tax=Dikerogammarus haemobaphes virus 1 TaxID=2704946 RepID=A0A6G9HES9_9VIRU|nr:Pox virus entry-fusion-complex G9/A16 [Dikerogammarus haemobaphes virus 1]